MQLPWGGRDGAQSLLPTANIPSITGDVADSGTGDRPQRSHHVRTTSEHARVRFFRCWSTLRLLLLLSPLLERLRPVLLHDPKRSRREFANLFDTRSYS